MQLKWFVVLLFPLNIILIFDLPQALSQEQRLVFEGAVISARGKTRALATINTGLVGIMPRDKVGESLGAGAMLVTSKDLVSARGVGDAAPRPYSRKLDPCKRAKERTWMKKILGRYRCESNNAYFSSAVPNDTHYSSQYASSFMSLPNAWDRTTGSAELIALVIDSGVLYSHPDLAANMWRNPGEIASDGVDNDNNGYIDDVHGINAILNTGNPLDDNGHGTHCAGILGGRGNNGQGVAGVAWNTKIAAAKFLSSSGSGSLSNAVKAINYGTALRRAGNKIVVSNNSWGGGSFSSTLAAAIQSAGDAGILFVAAAGNSASNNDTTPSYPSSYSSSNVLAVASTTSSGTLSSFSNYGATSVDIAAPGSSIISTYLSDNYAYLSGTSMAAPQVSGVALLAQAACNGTLTQQQVKTAVLSSGQQYSSLSGKVVTSAIANAYGAVMSALAYCQSAATPTPTPTATATATTTPTNTASSTPSATSTPVQPTASPVPSQTPIPVPPTATPVLPTATPVPPTATPSPTFTAPAPTATSTPVLIPPTATATPTPKPAPSRNKRPQFTVSSSVVSGEASLVLSISDGGTARSASLRVFGRDARWTWACPTITIPLTAGAASVAVQLPMSVSKMNVLPLFATVGNYTIQKQLAVSGSKPSKDYREGQAAFSQVCSSISRAVRATATQRRANMRNG
jgi:subtilisin family serine protease